MRKLATVQQILSLEPIPGYDAIEAARVLGWTVVVKKGEFTPGGLCIYCEPDSILPETPAFEFLARHRYRIKARRIGKVISQGIAFPLDILDEGVLVGYVTDPEDHEDGIRRWRAARPEGSFQDLPLEPGTEVTGILGVTKYDPPEVNDGSRSQAAGVFPAHLVSKTDETRVQAIPEVLAEMAAEGVPCYITEKLDGSSMTVLHDLTEGSPRFRVCSRNLEAWEVPGCYFWGAARELLMEEKLRDYCAARPGVHPSGLAVQGELVGPGVNGNRARFIERTFRVFKVTDLATGRPFSFGELITFSAETGLTLVPIVEEEFVVGPGVTVDTLLELATRRTARRDDLWAEGIVVRPRTPRYHPLLGGLSFKVINPEYMLAHGL